MNPFLEGDIEELGRKVTSLELRMIALESRVIEGEGVRIQQWKIIVRLAALLADIEGVPQDEIAEVIQKIPPGI